MLMDKSLHNIQSGIMRHIGRANIIINFLGGVNQHDHRRLSQSRMWNVKKRRGDDPRFWHRTDRN